jgi:hypothetical protein
MEVDENTSVTIPIRNLLAIIAAVAVAVIGYFEISNRISVLERDTSFIQYHVDANTEFRVTVKPPEYVESTVILANENKIRIEYLEQKLDSID